MKAPKITIITVNYNGKEILKKFLESVEKLIYPKDLLDVVVVDNNSSDGSVSYIKKIAPSVKVIKSKKNLGFGGGNNMGIKAAKGDFLLLVNNDTVIDPDCLLSFNDCYRRWSAVEKIGAISAKLVLIDKYIPITLRNAFLHDYVYSKRRDYGVNKAPYIIKRHTGERDQERVYLPVSYRTEGQLDFELTVKNPGELGGMVSVGKKYSSKINYLKHENFKKINFRLSNKETEECLLDLVQNAGSYVFRDGYGRDRGSLIVGGNQYYEEDIGQYDKEEKISAFCGAGVFVNKKALNEVGGFDETFFMYYEDDDLSFRFRKAGWEIVYCPKARIRHIHAASSKEWSQSFIYNVERSRLLFVGKHWPTLLVVWEWAKYIFKDTIAVPVGHLFFMEYRVFLGKLRLRLKVNLSVAPHILRSLMRSSRLSYADIKSLY